MTENTPETQGETATAIFAAVREAIETIGIDRLRAGPFFGLGERDSAPEAAT